VVAVEIDLVCAHDAHHSRYSRGIRIAHGRSEECLRRRLPRSRSFRVHHFRGFDSLGEKANPPIDLPQPPRASLDKKSCQWYRFFVLDLQVIDDPAAATAALEPMRGRLLSELVVPASAATLATRVGLTRQKVNYYLHGLEAHGLVRLAEERKWGGLTERLLVATAASYVVSPSALGPVAADPSREIDRLSASYLIALGARVVHEVGDLVRRAKETGKRLATLAVDTEVRFRSATDRAAFSNELAEAIAKLVSKYHDESAPSGRRHRLVIVAHPLPQKSHPKSDHLKSDHPKSDPSSNPKETS
jgi:DNA-binding transcriptional ArsR family regulator